MSRACLRPELFDTLARDVGPFAVDLFADQPGLLSLCAGWCCPEATVLEHQFNGQRCWAHPPRKLIVPFIQFINALKAQSVVQVAVLIPVDAGAPWYNKRLLTGWRRRQQWPVGSDLFRARSADDLWTKVGPTDLPYVVLTSWWNKTKNVTELFGFTCVTFFVSR
jgi:hypothetical protein